MGPNEVAKEGWGERAGRWGRLWGQESRAIVGRRARGSGVLSFGEQWGSSSTTSLGRGRRLVSRGRWGRAQQAWAHPLEHGAT